MNQKDDKLSSLLRQWRDVEPAGNFEANVRRRIRLAVVDSPRSAWLAGLSWRPAISVAVAVSVIIGSSAGIVTAVKSARPTSGELQFLSAGTLAGSYVKLSSEGAR